MHADTVQKSTVITDKLCCPKGLLSEDSAGAGTFPDILGKDPVW